MNKILLILAITFSLFAAACRKDQPPLISIVCILDGKGAGNCAHPDDTTETLLPSQMKNYWCTTQDDQANFAAWCYKTDVAKVNRQMQVIKARIDTATRIGLISEEAAGLLAVDRPDDAEAVLDGELAGGVSAVTVVQ